MKKKNFFIVLSIVIILVGGIYLKKTFDEKQLLKTEAPRIEKYLKYNFEGINSITFSEVLINPTGIPHIKGYINNNKDFRFNAGIYDEHFEGALNFRGSVKPVHKFSDESEKNVSEIEEEEKNIK